MDKRGKRESAEDPSKGIGFLSALTFSYALKIFRVGYRRDLELSDLFTPLEKHKSSFLGDLIMNLWDKEQDRCNKEKEGSHPSLLKVLWQWLGAKIVIHGFVRAFYELIRVSQPLMLARLLRFFSKNSNMTKDEAYMWAGGVIFCSLSNLLTFHCIHISLLMGMNIRVACCSLVYRKILRLSKAALAETTTGQVINLLSNDVKRFDNAIQFLNFIWIGPLQTALITYLIYIEMGCSAVVGMAPLLMFIPLQGYLGKKASILRMKTALRTDVRLRLMNEIINGIQVIKMYSWEKPFSHLVGEARRAELHSIKKTGIIQGIVKSFEVYVPRLALFATILTYVLLGNHILAEKVFMMTSFYTILRISMNIDFPLAILRLSQALVTMERLQQFMIKREMTKQPPAKELYKMDTSVSSPVAISMKDVTAKWVPNAKENSLSNLNLNVEPGKLVAVIGQVGSGKTSLLQAILRELPLQHGTIETRGKVAYASQEPWLFASSLRQNILFGRTMDKALYDRVVDACQLRRDFAQLGNGDKTIVGERGIILSGGQCARVNLARTMYAEADIYLLDDPLAAVDSYVGKRVFEQCFEDYMRQKTRILVTHQLHYLEKVDYIIVMNGGRVQAEGTLEELQASGRNLLRLLEQPDEDEDANNPQKSCRRASTSSSQPEEEDKVEPIEVAEVKSSGQVSGQVYRSYFVAAGSVCYISVMFALFVLNQVAASGGDYFITYWVNAEERSLSYVNQSVIFRWNDILGRDECLYLCVAITIASVIMTFLQTLFFFEVCIRSSITLHSDMFNRISQATMHFFHTNISGRILNRFSEDMGIIDELLPLSMIDSMQMSLTTIGVIILVLIVNPWLVIPTVLLGTLLYLLRVVFLRTSSSVRRLEGITRSPVFGHVTGTLQGLTTIRASNTEAILSEEFDSHQDLHTSAWLMFAYVSRAFAFYVDLVGVIFTAIVTFSFLVVDQETFGGNVGLAITQCLGLGKLMQFGIRQSAEMESYMTSVERVVEYGQVEQESPHESNTESKPPKGWPTNGRLEFRDTYLRYSQDEPCVLKNLNFVIMPNEKIGIVGRTGAGKSSLISALFRLAPIDGKILIDGVPTSLIGLHDLRSRISIIPQEPVLFSGSLRKNLDPFEEHPDYRLWQALQEVELTRFVNELGAGLNSEISERGSNFSVGQRQLVCLARAVLRRNKILILDEATANVDPKTDALIQSTIRRKFADSTVLTIAHRLNTVMDSDKVLVMDAGAMVEFDHPYTLLQNKQGFLYKIVGHCGDDMAKILRNMAEENYFKRKSS